MLVRLRDVLIDEGVDMLVQFYGFCFDLPYLAERAAFCSCHDFFRLGKLRVQETAVQKKSLVSAGAGENTMHFFPMPGRGNFDVFMWYKLNYKRPTYDLNSICAEHTGESKLDFDYKLIGPAFRGTAEQRAEMARYCVQDCELLRALMEKLRAVTDQVEQSRVSRVVMEQLVTHGQSNKVNGRLDYMCQRICDMGVYADEVLNNLDDGGGGGGPGEGGRRGAAAMGGGGGDDGSRPPREGAYASRRPKAGLASARHHPRRAARLPQPDDRSMHAACTRTLRR